MILQILKKSAKNFIIIKNKQFHAKFILFLKNKKTETYEKIYKSLFCLKIISFFVVAEIISIHPGGII